MPGAFCVLAHDHVLVKLMIAEFGTGPTATTAVPCSPQRLAMYRITCASRAAAAGRDRPFGCDLRP